MEQDEKMNTATFSESINLTMLFQTQAAVLWCRKVATHWVQSTEEAVSHTHHKNTTVCILMVKSGLSTDTSLYYLN